MTARLVWGAMGAAGLLALLLLLRSGHRAPTLIQPVQPQDSVEEPAAVPREAPPDPTRGEGLKEVVDLGSPREVSPAARGAVIALKEGGPAEGAALSWSPVTPRLVASIWDWDEIDLSWWNTATSFATADPQGLVAPETPDVAAMLGSVVWIDLPGHEPVFDVLTSDWANLDGKRYELVERKTVRIKVQDALGQPVQEAVVEQHGADLRKGSEVPTHVPQLFHRTRTTGADGTCEISRFPGRQAVVARRGEAVSRPVVVGEQTDDVVLRILDSFTISGTVTRPTSPDIVGEIVPRVTISAQHGNLWRELGTAVAREGDEWGPLTLPCEPSVQYRAEVHGVGVIPDETCFPPPAPGESVILNLEAVAGIVQWFIAYADEERTPLPDARVWVSWLEDGTWRGVSADARPDGFISVLGIRPGLVRAVASCPGRLSVAFPLQELPPTSPKTLSVILPEGTTMSGRVVRDGLPVPDFEITYWPSDDIDLRRSKTYRDQLDGTFFIGDAFVEPMGIVAAAPGSPGSEPLQVEVTEEGIQGLEIELVGVMPGSGRVVRKSDGEPLAEAAVQPYVLGGGNPVSPWGPPVAVRPDGRFDLEAFREGENCLFVTAPGFSARPVYAKSEGQRVDFGVIALERAADVRVEIAGASEASGYRLEVHGVLPAGTADCERDETGDLVGWLRELALGPQTFRLAYPDNTDAIFTVDVSESTEVIRVPGGGGALLVELQQIPEADGPLALFVVHEAEGMRDFSRTAVFKADGTAHVAGLRPGPAKLFLRVLDKTLASTTATILDGEVTLVPLGASESDLLVRVLDSKEEPVPGTTVGLYGKDAVEDGHGGLTDEKGQFLFRALNPGRYVLHVRHPSLGLLPDQEILVQAEEDLEREVVLDGRAALELLVADDDVPLPGLTCRLLDRDGRNLSSPVLTNEEGRAAIPRLAPGNYRLNVTGSAVWKLDTEVQAGAGLHTLQVRRLGDLRVRVVNADGIPVHEAGVSLVFEPTGELVQDWIAAGLVAAPGGLATDKHGEIALTGLPRGVYAWRCGAAQGSLTVVPAKESSALIALE